MSIEAMVWALKKAPVLDPISHLVLIGLADHASGDGTAAWPSVKTLAGYARCSPRSVHNKLRLLEDGGVILRGDQRIVAHLRGDRRPVVYDLPIHGVQPVHPEGHALHDGVNGTRDGVHGGVSRGAPAGSDGVHAGAHKPSMNLPEPSLEHSPSAAADDARRVDEAWRAVYDEFDPLGDVEEMSAAAMIHRGWGTMDVLLALRSARARRVTA